MDINCPFKAALTMDINCPYISSTKAATPRLNEIILQDGGFSPSHRTQSACFVSLQALLSCGALERARSSLKLASEQHGV
jgi:hypothetical protein